MQSTAQPIQFSNDWNLTNQLTEYGLNPNDWRILRKREGQQWLLVFLENSSTGAQIEGVAEKTKSGLVWRDLSWSI